MALHHLEPLFLMIVNSLGVTGNPENMMSAGASDFLSQESTKAWSQVKRPRFQGTFILICLSSSMAHVHEPNCTLMPLTSACTCSPAVCKKFLCSEGEGKRGDGLQDGACCFGG